MLAQLLTPSAAIATLLRSLCPAVFSHGQTLGLARPFINLIILRLRCIADRIEAIAARGGPRLNKNNVVVGVQEQPSHRTRATHPSEPAAPPAVVLPRRFGWLVRTITSVANICSPSAGARDYLLIQFQQPAMQAMITSDPAFTPVIRSLCHMFGITPPTWLPRRKRREQIRQPGATKPKPRPRQKSPIHKPARAHPHQVPSPYQIDPHRQPAPPPGVSPLAFFFPGTYRD